MANIKSAKKRVLTAERNRQRNMRVKSAYRTAIRRLQEAVAGNEAADTVQQRLGAVYSHLDRAVLKGIVHKNTAARVKSRLSRRALQSA